MGNVGPMEIVVIAVFGLLVFGPQKLPEMARTVARALKEFKQVSGEFTKDLTSELDLNSYEPKSKRTAEPQDSGSRAGEPDEPRPGPK